MVRAANQEKPQYTTFTRGGRKKKKAPKPKPPKSAKRAKGEKLYVQSLTPTGQKAHAKLPPDIQAKLKTATVGQSAGILRTYRKEMQAVRKRRSRK